MKNAVTALQITILPQPDKRQQIQFYKKKSYR